MHLSFVSVDLFPTVFGLFVVDSQDASKGKIYESLDKESATRISEASVGKPRNIVSDDRSLTAVGRLILPNS